MRFADLFESIILESNVVNATQRFSIHYPNEQGINITHPFVPMTLMERIEWWIDRETKDPRIQKWTKTVLYKWVLNGCPGIETVQDCFPDDEKTILHFMPMHEYIDGLLSDEIWGEGPEKRPNPEIEEYWSDFIYNQLPNWCKKPDAVVDIMFDAWAIDEFPMTEIIDYLKALAAANDPMINRLDRMSVLQALRSSWIWHNQKMKAAGPDKEGVDFKPIMHFKDGYVIVQLLTPKSLDNESAAMGHCIGKGSYDDKVQSGSTKLFSLRDKENKPHATLEVSDGKVKQIKGTKNGAVATKVHDHIYRFLLTKGLVLAGDHDKIGLERDK